jgi:hypothetical protein
VFSRWYLHIWLTKKSFSTCGFQSAVSQSHTHTTDSAGSWRRAKESRSLFFNMDFWFVWFVW